MMKIRCPQCGRQTFWQDNPSRPFCSERCRLIDLMCWDNEDYTVAGNRVDPEAHSEDDDISSLSRE